MTFGERVRSLRSAHRWTLRDLSERTGGVSIGYLSELERGNKCPTLTVVEKVAAGFGIPVLMLIAPIFGEMPRGGLRADDV